MIKNAGHKTYNNATVNLDGCIILPINFQYSCYKLTLSLDIRLIEFLCVIHSVSSYQNPLRLRDFQEGKELTKDLGDNNKKMSESFDSILIAGNTTVY